MDSVIRQWPRTQVGSQVRESGVSYLRDVGRFDVFLCLLPPPTERPSGNPFPPSSVSF